MMKTLINTIFLCVMFWSSPVLAQSTITKDQAKEYIYDVLDEVESAINKSSSDSDRFKSFLNLFENRADVPIITRYLIGPDWRQMSSNDKSFATSQVGKYLAKKYGSQFSYFTESEFKVKKVVEKKTGVYFLIDTEVDHKSDGKFIIEWRLSTKSGEPRLVDIVIEGISMLMTEKTEVQARIDQTKGSNKVRKTMEKLY